MLLVVSRDLWSLKNSKNETFETRGLRVYPPPYLPRVIKRQSMEACAGMHRKFWEGADALPFNSCYK
jgi:hypothetical protein